MCANTHRLSPSRQGHRPHVRNHQDLQPSHKSLIPAHLGHWPRPQMPAHSAGGGVRGLEGGEGQAILAAACQWPACSLAMSPSPWLLPGRPPAPKPPQQGCVIHTPPQANKCLPWTAWLAWPANDMPRPRRLALSGTCLQLVAWRRHPRKAHQAGQAVTFLLPAAPF